jgi:hypothetical protein
MELVEIYECDWTVDPKDADRLTTLELAAPGLLPALGDVISLIIDGAFVHVRVLARTHLASIADSTKKEARWLKASLFVTRVSATKSSSA